MASCSGVRRGLNICILPSDHRSKSWQRAVSTPNISAMAIVGSGRAYVSITSKQDGSSISSSKPHATSVIRGRMASTADRLNDLTTRSRRRLWSGSSICSMSGRNVSSTLSCTRENEPGRDFRGSEARLRSFITASTSAARVSTSRSNVRSWCTGSRDLSTSRYSSGRSRKMGFKWVRAIPVGTAVSSLFMGFVLR
jgi:hypothetical protein